MTYIDIRNRLHTSIHLEFQNPVTINLKQVSEYEVRLGMKIPQWYLDFLEQYGSIQGIVEKSSSTCTFDTQDSQGYHQDYHNEDYTDLDFRIPLGNDLGDRALFYSERDGKPGIYVSYGIPDEDYFRFLSSDFESFLFDGIGLKEYVGN